MDIKPSQFTKEQINGILREQDAGTKMTDFCRKYGICSSHFCKWKLGTMASTCRTLSG